MDHWPLPPFYKEAGTPAAPTAADAMVFARDGSTHVGQLTDFDPTSQTLRLQAKGKVLASQARFATIKSVHLIQPIRLEPDARLISVYQQLTGQQIQPSTRPFVVHFTDHEQLQGQTQGFVKTRHGLFVFLTTVTDQVVRIFIPDSAIERYHVGPLLGAQLVESAAIQPETLSQALAEQARRRALPMSTPTRQPFRPMFRPPPSRWSCNNWPTSCPGPS